MAVRSPKTITIGGLPVSRRTKLTDAGADVNARDNNGYTPLDWTNYERISESKARLEIGELLREKGGKSGAIQTNP